MIALILKGGMLEQVHEPDASRLRLPVRRATRFELPRKVELTRDQRRKEARRSSGKGRRRARRVEPLGYVAPKWSPKPDVDVYKAHLLSDGQRDVRLFLLDGQDVTDEHCRDVERWLLRHL
jgi:hypothetical protein